MFAADLKTRIRDKQLTLGPFFTFDFWPGYLEIFKAEGMDFVVVDLEHGSPSLSRVEELCRTARLLNLPLLIRPEASVFHLLRKYADLGPAGFMLPWIECQSQIDTVRDAIFTPPRGRRGPGGPSILANRSLDRSGWDEVESSLFVMMQIESPLGLRSLRSFHSWDWVDAVMLGPYDLSLNLNHCGDIAHPEVVEAIDQVFAESAAVGKPCGMVVGNPEQAKFWMDRGCRFLITSEVSSMVRAQARHLLKQIRNGA